MRMAIRDEALLTDISTHKLVAEAIRESEKRYRNILNTRRSEI